MAVFNRESCFATVTKFMIPIDVCSQIKRKHQSDLMIFTTIAKQFPLLNAVQR